MRRSTACVFAGAAMILCSCARTTVSNAPSTAAEREAKAEGDLCKNMARDARTVHDYPQIAPETPLRDIKSANEKTERAVQQVAKAGNDINNPQILIIEAAYQQLRNVTDSISGGRATVGPASEEIRLHSDHLRAAWDSLYTSLQCGA